MTSTADARATGRISAVRGRLSLRAVAPEAQLAVLVMTATAAALRFATLGTQSLSNDEGFTVHLSRLSFGGMLGQLPKTESTPPLHYVLVWLWGHIFGTDEVGLRSLSALCGTLTVPVMYAVARATFSRRAGVIAAAISCVSPILVWYSQEARSYALLVLLAAVSLYFFVRLREERTPRLLLGWALSGGLALATHYFAALLVIPEAALLIYGARPRRPMLLASLMPLAVLIAIAPLAYAQRHPAAGWMNKWTIPAVAPLGHRILQLPRELLFGFKEPLGVPATIVLAGLAMYAAVAVMRAGAQPKRRRAGVLALIAAIGFALPVAAALVSRSLDLVETRFFLGTWVPVLIVIAGGFAVARAGVVCAGAFCGVSLVGVVAVFANPLYQRHDIRGAARVIGRPTVPRLVLVTGAPQQLANDYLHGIVRIPYPARVSEVDVLAMPAGEKGSPPSLVRVGSPQTGFQLTERKRTPRFTVLRFRSPTPQSLYLYRLSPRVWRGWKVSDVGQAPQLGLVLQVPASSGRR